MKKRQKKFYEKPEMKIYGDIKDITRNAGDWGQDASIQSSSG
jgi:hypothetical protein